MLDFEEYLNGLRAAAEPTRLRLLILCAEGELTVTELTQILGQSQPRVSRHLKLMVDAGLLERFREGTWAFYRIARQSDTSAVARTLVDMVPLDDQILVRDRERLSQIKDERSEFAAAYFSRNARQWDEIRKLHADDAVVEAALLDVIGNKPVKSLLDVGTGTGRILTVLGPRIGRGLGIDASREMLAVARDNLDRAGVTNCQVRFGDMYSLSSESGAYDLITIHQVLHYSDHPQQVIAEAARLVAPAGRIVIVDFAPHALEHLRDEHAHRRLGFSDKEVSDWLRAAGMAPKTPVDIAGDPLTVKIWMATRTEEAVKATAATA